MERAHPPLTKYILVDLDDYALARLWSPIFQMQVALARMRIVTVYEPDPSEWSDWRTRRIDHDQ